MFSAVLFDLDDTLLGNDMGVFLPAYFARLGDFATPRIERNRFRDALVLSTRAMIECGDPTQSNSDVFWQHFAPASGMAREEAEAFFDRFYRDEFPHLEGLTQPRAEARDLVALCADRGWPLVIATNPVFPRIAIEERLRWAGIPVTEWSYALVTSYENMHSTKPRPSYYREIAERLLAEPATMLMVGNDPRQDTMPARRAGMQTFTVLEGEAAGPADPSGGVAGLRSGTLGDLLAWLSSL